MTQNNCKTVEVIVNFKRTNNIFHKNCVFAFIEVLYTQQQSKCPHRQNKLIFVHPQQTHTSIRNILYYFPYMCRPFPKSTLHLRPNRDIRKIYLSQKRLPLGIALPLSPPWFSRTLVVLNVYVNVPFLFQHHVFDTRSRAVT